VRCKVLDNPQARALGLQHCFFVIIDCNKKSFTAGAYAGTEPGKPDSTKESPYGDRMPAYEAPSDEAVKGTAPGGPLKLKGKTDYCTFWDCLQRRMSAPQRPYDPVSYNSNGFIKDAISACGGDHPLPESAPTNEAEGGAYLLKKLKALGLGEKQAREFIEKNAAGIPRPQNPYAWYGYPNYAWEQGLAPE
jgi:hypothetical protein